MFKKSIEKSLLERYLSEMIPSWATMSIMIKEFEGVEELELVEDIEFSLDGSLSYSKLKKKSFKDVLRCGKSFKSVKSSGALGERAREYREGALNKLSGKQLYDKYFEEGKDCITFEREIIPFVYKEVCVICDGDPDICGECNGSKKVACVSCNETGTVTCGCGGKKSSCYSCSGSGVLTCGCQGMRETCMRCSGSGRVLVPQSQAYINCSYCYATGRVDCSSCGGTQRVNCSSCGGSGSRYCSSCGGSDTLSCGVCGGKGKKACMNCNGYGEFFCDECNNERTLSKVYWLQPEISLKSRSFVSAKTVSKKKEFLKNEVLGYFKSTYSRPYDGEELACSFIGELPAGGGGWFSIGEYAHSVVDCFKGENCGLVLSDARNEEGNSLLRLAYRYDVKKYTVSLIKEGKDVVSVDVVVVDDRLIFGAINEVTSRIKDYVDKTIDDQDIDSLFSWARLRGAVERGVHFYQDEVFRVFEKAGSKEKAKKYVGLFPEYVQLPKGFLRNLYPEDVMLFKSFFNKDSIRMKLGLLELNRTQNIFHEHCDFFLQNDEYGVDYAHSRWRRLIKMAYALLVFAGALWVVSGVGYHVGNFVSFSVSALVILSSFSVMFMAINEDGMYRNMIFKDIRKKGLRKKKAKMAVPIFYKAFNVRRKCYGNKSIGGEVVVPCLLAVAAVVFFVLSRDGLS